ncbi:MAG TPA: heterodisulfide reductase-related iron-sulfur binding cluster [Candidatus Limnocylindria bacterium]|nr:heterodisulfide reductase-related iron-sulfur binding cluster [Candidatus Limnocylindria bacterium]
MTARAPDFAPPDGLYACVHCGLCLDACPTYLEVGTEMDSPRGRIQLMQGLAAGRLPPGGAVRTHLDRCLGCRACETACPSGVPYGRLIEAARPIVERARSVPARVLRGLLVRALASRAGTLPLRLAARLPARRLVARLLPGRWGAYLAALPQRRRATPLPSILEPRVPPRGTAVLVTGCVSESLFPSTNRAAALLLQRAGVRVVVVRDRCCGALFAHAGDDAAARRRAAALLDAAPGEADWFVTTASGCGAHLQGLAHLLPGRVDAERLAARARDALALLAELGLPAAERPMRETIAVHDPCHLAHGQGVRSEVRTLLGTIPGLQLVELRESDTCCGSAGTYNLTERELAARLLDRKMKNVAASGAGVIAAANPGCLLQMRAGAIARRLPVAVEHPFDLLARAHGL